MALYFIRHGESESNERNLFAGRFDTPLTSLGRRQAAQAKAKVEALGLHFDEVHFTPLSRAKDTAELIVTTPDTIRVEVAELVERDFGKLSEQNKSLIKKYFGADKFEHMFHSAAGAPPNGEAFKDMYDRVRKYYFETLEPLEKQGKTVLVVAHKYIIEMFALLAADVAPENYHDFKIPNCKPLTFAQLNACVQSVSPGMNRIAEETEARLAPLLLGASLVGGFLRFAIDVPIASTVFTILMLCFLFVNSGFSLLRLESRVFLTSGTSLKRIWKAFLPRYLLGLGLIVFGKNEIAVSIGAFLLLPPAMTSPTLSLAWGGDYFLSSQATIISTLLSPILLIIGGALALHSVITPSQFVTYVLSLVIAVVLPGVIAQYMRTKNPIASGAMSTNWGWLGGAVMVPLSALASYEFFPSRAQLGELTMQSFMMQLCLVVGLFALLRVFAGVSSLVRSNNKRANLDRYITHIAPNIFFWFTLLSNSPRFAELRFAVTLCFFASIYLEEKRIVRSFPILAGLQVRKMSSTKFTFGILRPAFGKKSSLSKTVN